MSYVYQAPFIDAAIHDLGRSIWQIGQPSSLSACPPTSTELSAGFSTTSAPIDSLEVLPRACSKLAFAGLALWTLP